MKNKVLFAILFLLIVCSSSSFGQPKLKGIWEIEYDNIIKYESFLFLNKGEGIYQHGFDFSKPIKTGQYKNIIIKNINFIDNELLKLKYEDEKNKSCIYYITTAIDSVTEKEIKNRYGLIINDGKIVISIQETEKKNLYSLIYVHRDYTYNYQIIFISKLIKKEE